MNPQRQRRSRRGGGGKTRGGKTNIDDLLEEAKTSMINITKVAVDPSKESRFTMHSSNDLNDLGRGVCADSLEDNPAHKANLSKHQVNYSATKYIKP
mmetsp:Transcript_21774/g.31789  ORF Transcript_21774/g.31789 Transcript_21774/m.31789 type:complete len:97 (-) Transcript_21774:619-909(-)|eukprot:CAMPEP_0197247196 /NCGR_PEP_ID=MMETSP1429-20130617/26494_1 /TAXON_ID=49237 /ORGANISM="Chaetoceros  sp., Strain UNC1202" /LENGTH=96 /DNA_ID=CAMNT_0042708045 /DNA_START=66 /DNA_END=356 /DNA_ORIENTATION=+